MHNIFLFLFLLFLIYVVYASTKKEDPKDERECWRLGDRRYDDIMDNWTGEVCSLPCSRGTTGCYKTPYPNYDMCSSALNDGATCKPCNKCPLLPPNFYWPPCGTNGEFCACK